MLNSILKKIGNRKPESKMGSLALAATTGITVARSLGKRSIYGALAGIGLSLIAKKLKNNRKDKNLDFSDKSPTGTKSKL
ncbi:hypothetical protein ACF3NR_01225 [Vaginella massiliensis]|uniref:hypothetical protein n=1 Tax=Vaginella massiliensis TaxID=1816680 RepID=UPI0008399D0B|nr:hypothetical protein [Vaginella massiliensis]